MKCKIVQNKLSAFLDKELESKELDLIKQHLMTCPDCQKELRIQKKVQQKLDAFKMVIPNDIVLTNIFSQTTRKKKTNRWSLLGLAASILFSFWFGLYTSSSSYDTSTSSDLFAYESVLDAIEGDLQ